MLYDNIRCPTMVLRGERSDLITRDTASKMSERGPRAKVVEIAGVGHAPTLIHADQIQLVRTFLDTRGTRKFKPRASPRELAGKRASGARRSLRARPFARGLREGCESRGSAPLPTLWSPMMARCWTATTTASWSRTGSDRVPRQSATTGQDRERVRR